MDDHRKYILKRDVKLLLVFIIFISILFNVPSHLRYHITNIFTESKVIYEDPKLGLLNIEYGHYDLFLNPVNEEIHIDLNEIDFEHEYYIIGNYYNSNKSMTVILNDTIVYNGKPKTEFSNVFEKNYLHKKYIIRLGEINKNSELEILIGKEKFKYDIYLY